MSRSNCVFVSHIREFHTEDALKEYFQQFGDVSQVRLIKCNECKNGCKVCLFGFVRFCDADSAEKCLYQKFHMVQGLTCKVDNGKSTRIAGELDINMQQFSGDNRL